MTVRGNSYLPFLLLFLALTTLLKGWFAAFVELCPDEAYYWVWSKNLAAGYFDHPPGVAFLIRIGTSFFGDNPLGVRFMAFLLSAVSAWMIYVLTVETTGSKRRAFWVAVLFSVCPIVTTGAVVHTPDAGLACAWLGSCWLALKAFKTEKLLYWVGLGACIGLGVLFKTSGWLLLWGLGLFLIFCKAGRVRLFSPGPALSVLGAFVVASPNLVWNLQHAGGSWAFQMEHAFGSFKFMPLHFFYFLGAQIGITSPLLWIALVGFMAVGWVRPIRFGRPDVFLAWCLSAPLFAGMMGLAWVHKMEANWPVIAYLAAVPASGWIWRGGVFYLERFWVWMGAGLVLACGMTLVIVFQSAFAFLPISPEKDPTARLRGYETLSKIAMNKALELDAGLGAEGYGTVSQLRFHGATSVVYERSSTRKSQYDLWQQERTRPNRLLFLQPKTTPYPPLVCQDALKQEPVEIISEEPNLFWVSQYRFWFCQFPEPGGETNHAQPS